MSIFNATDTNHAPRLIETEIQLSQKVAGSHSQDSTYRTQESKPEMLSLSETLKPLLEQSTAHGIPRATRGPSIFRRIFWICIFTVCFVSFIVQTGFLCSRFFSFPVNTKLTVRTRKNVTWPAVTVCNLNKFSKIQIDNVGNLVNINGLIFQAAIELMYQEYQECRAEEQMFDCGNGECGFQFWTCDGVYDCDSSKDERNLECCDSITASYKNQQLDRGASGEALESVKFECSNSSGYCVHGKLRCNGVVDCPDGSDEANCDGLQKKYDARPWVKAYKEGKRKDYSDLQTAGTAGPETVRSNGIQINDFIIECSFDSVRCNLEDFYTWQNDVYGNCFTFNHVNKPAITTSRQGSQNGLKLTLFVDQADYVGLLSPASGVRVSVHPRNIKPFPEDGGMSVSPGTASFIRIHENKFVREGPPFGDCTQNVWPNSVKSESAREFDYSTKSCNKYCFAEYILEKCGCLSSLILADGNNTKDEEFCSIVNATQNICQQEALADYSMGKLECNCKVSCEETRYQTHLSSATWPQVSYLWNFVRVLYRESGDKIQQFVGKVRNRLVANNFLKETVIRELQNVRDNFVKLDIYFDNLSLEEIYEEEQISLVTFMSLIGGSVGIWTGISLTTHVEAGEVIFYWINWKSVKRSQDKQQINENTRASEKLENQVSSIQNGSWTPEKDFPGTFPNFDVS